MQAPFFAERSDECIFRYRTAGMLLFLRWYSSRGVAADAAEAILKDFTVWYRRRSRFG